MKMNLRAESPCKLSKIKKGNFNGNPYLLVTLTKNGDHMNIFADIDLAEYLEENVGQNIYPLFEYINKYHSDTKKSYTSMKLTNIILPEKK